jgi:U3 small nucleolar ribonucleoprotein protein IMP3
VIGLKKLKKDDNYRIKKTKEILDKLYDIGLIKNKTNLLDIEKIGISTFCRRRLSYLLFKNKYCETIKEGVTFIEQGNVRVGIETITNPAFLVTKAMEDHITWSNQSKIKRKIMEYNDAVDDYDILN